MAFHRTPEHNKIGLKLKELTDYPSPSENYDLWTKVLSSDIKESNYQFHLQDFYNFCNAIRHPNVKLLKLFVDVGLNPFNHDSPFKEYIKQREWSFGAYFESRKYAAEQAENPSTSDSDKQRYNEVLKYLDVLQKYASKKYNTPAPSALFASSKDEKPDSKEMLCARSLNFVDILNLIDQSDVKQSVAEQHAIQALLHDVGEGDVELTKGVYRDLNEKIFTIVIQKLSDDKTDPESFKLFQKIKHILNKKDAEILKDQLHIEEAVSNSPKLS